MTHRGGDPIAAANLNITVAGNTTYSSGTLVGAVPGDVDGDGDDDIHTIVNEWNDDSITATDRFAFYEEPTDEWIVQRGDTVSVIWTSDSGETAILAEDTVQ